MQSRAGMYRVQLAGGPAVAVRARAVGGPDGLLDPGHGVLRKGASDARFQDHGGIVLSLAFVDDLDHPVGRDLAGEHDAAVHQWSRGALEDKVVGEVLGRDGHVAFGNVLAPLLLEVDAVQADDGEAGDEADVEARGAYDAVDFELFPLGRLEPFRGELPDLAPNDFDLGRTECGQVALGGGGSTAAVDGQRSRTLFM